MLISKNVALLLVLRKEVKTVPDVPLVKKEEPPSVKVGVKYAGAARL